MLARLVLLQETVIPTSDSESQVQGWNKRASLGHLNAGPGGMYSLEENGARHSIADNADKVSSPHFIFSVSESTKIVVFVDIRVSLVVL